MAEVKKLVLVEFTPAQIFDLVDDVGMYRDFLPWCGGAELLLRTDKQTVATIHINYHGVKAHFTTENEKRRPQEMHIRLKEGPFRHLDGHWHFKPLGDTACKITFELQYQFSNKLLEKAFGPVFNHIANTFVDSFVKRAEQVYPKNE